MKTISVVGRGVVGALLVVACSSSSEATSPDASRDDARVQADGALKNRDAAGPGEDAKGPAADARQDSSATPGTDAAVDSQADAARPPADASDARPGPDAADEAGAPARHVLVTYDGTSPTTAFAVNLETGAIDGTFTSPDSEAVTDTTNALAPFLLDQTMDVVECIDPVSWQPDGTWSVAQTIDAGGASADPYSVAVVAENQVYVARYGSNVVDVLDMTHAADGGAPVAHIDLSSLVQEADTDGVVEPTAAVYDPSSKLVYVVLGNVDLYTVTPPDYDLLCAATTSTVVAIDTTTNTLASLSDGGPGGAIALHGYDPIQGGVVYDAKNHRLLILEAGCNSAPTTDGGAPGAAQQRGVEEVDLVAHNSRVLLDASDQGFPGTLVYINDASAAVSFVYPTHATFAWDPTTTTLGASLPDAPDVFDSDGAGNLVGAVVTYADGGAATTDIVSMSLATGTRRTLQSNVIPLGNGYIASVGVWPRP